MTRTFLRPTAMCRAALLCGALVLSAVPSGAESRVGTRADSLSLARRMRERAETHLVRLERDHAQLRAELDDASGEAEAIALDLATARRTLRAHAVAAYVASGSESRLAAMMSLEDVTEAADRVNLSGIGAVDAADDVAVFEQMRADNDPDLVALADRLDSVERRLADATDALFQARAAESDAERAAQLAAQRVADRSAVQVAQGVAAVSVTVSTRSVEAPIIAVATPRIVGVELGVSAQSSSPQSSSPPLGGPSDEMWAALRRCESGGNYRVVSASGRYRGAYQFDVGTWASVGGTGDPAAATPEEQDLRARILYSVRGSRAWPVCGSGLRVV